MRRRGRSSPGGADAGRNTPVSGTIRITADCLIDGSGAPTRTGAEILVEDGMIVAVGTRREVASDDREASLHFPGCTILPGLVDSHVHLSISPDIEPGRVAQYLLETSDQTLVLRAERNARLLLGAGITTARDCGGPRDIPLTLRNAIRAGVVAGPRLLVSGRPITTTAGHCNFMGERADSEEEVRKATRKLCQEGVDFIKIMATGGMLTPASNPAAVQFSDAELAACVEEAHRLGRKVAAHVLCSAGVRAAVAAGIDTIEHCWTITGGRQDADDETIRLLAASGRFGSVTAHRALRALLCQGPDGITELRARLKPHRAMRQAGVPLPVHSDAGTPGTRFECFCQSVDCYHRGLATTFEEAVQAATQIPAEALGLGDQIGKVEPGYAADLIVVRGTPDRSDFSLADVCLTMLAGRLVAYDGRVKGRCAEKDIARPERGRN